MNKNNLVYIDIGYTNIKILKNNKIIIEPVKKTISLIKKLKKQFYCYIACNNLKYSKILSKFKNIYLISNSDFLNDIEISNEFKLNDLGIDLISYCYWVKKHNMKDAIILSSGTCLTLSIFKNNCLESVEILSGFDMEIKSIKKILKDIKIDFSEKFNHFNTEKAINSGYQNKIKGLIEINKQTFNIDKNIYLTGNYFKNFVINKADNIFQDTQIVDNLCLEAIKIKFQS